MIKYNKVLSTVVILFIFIIIFITLKNVSMDSFIRKIAVTTKKIILNEKILPQYKLDKNTLNKIYYADLVYEITDEKINPENIEDIIGKISEKVIIDINSKKLDKKYLKELYSNNKKNLNVNFKYVYKIKNKNSKENIAISINNKYFLAKLK